MSITVPHININEYKALLFSSVTDEDQIDRDGREEELRYGESGRCGMKPNPKWTAASSICNPSCEWLNPFG